MNTEHRTQGDPMSIFSRQTITADAFDAPTAVLDDISGEYTLDASHSRLGFSTRHAMVTTVRGQLSDFSGVAHVDTADPAASKVDLTIQVASIDTGSADRDGHLKSPDFFDVENFPTMTFVSTSVARDEDGVWHITGDFTIKDVTRSLTIPFETTGSARDPFGNLRVGFEGGVAINRKDWGLTWNAALETGGVLVGEKVEIAIELEAIATAAAQAA
jgi:polyisoprenoid-binding protein YceI